MSKRTLFYVLNFLMLALFVAALVKDDDREWKTYQKEYHRLQVEDLSAKAAKASDPQVKADLERQIKGIRHEGLGLKQLLASDLGRADRCVTCHQGYDPLTNPTMTTPFKDAPYRALDIPVHKLHPIEKFGCTSCHSGQGLATTVKDSHGFVDHWEQPMFEGTFIQASCVRCHANFEKLKGAEQAARGKALVKRLGCVGCHSFNGVGGEVSVDLGDIADKPTSRIDWAHTGPCKDGECEPLPPDERNVQNWILLHFTKDTMELNPGDPEGKMCAPGQKCEPVTPSGMPPFYKELSKEDAAAITTYLMGQTSVKVPSNFYVYAPPEPEPKFANATEHGKHVFQKYGCAGCHGEGGAAGRRNFNMKADNQTKMEDGREPTLVKVVGTFSRDELRKKIQDGVPASAVVKFKEDGPTPPGYMPSWKEKIKGPELEDLMTYLFSIAEKQESW